MSSLEEKLMEIEITKNKYVTIFDPKFAIFYLLPRIHKRLNNVPGRPNNI